MNGEIEKRLVQLLDGLTKEKPPVQSRGKRVLAFLNTPFFLTFLGGIIIMSLTFFVEARIAHNARESENRTALLEQRKSTVSAFADVASRSLSIAYEMLQRKIWLSQHQGPTVETASLSFVDGRTFNETRNLYESQKQRYLECQSIDALIAQAHPLFPQLYTLLNEFQKKQEEFLQSDTQAALDYAFGHLMEQYGTVIQRMSENVLASLE